MHFKIFVTLHCFEENSSINNLNPKIYNNT